MSKSEYPNFCQVWPRSEEQNDCEIEVVAVHGLAANPKTTWLSDGDNTKDRVNWLCHPDMLPAILPRARIWTFNFRSDWLGEGPLQQIHFLGRHLLQFMRQKLRYSRPIIFLAHSFGGIVVAQALVSSQKDERMKDILHWTTGAVFLGTPFHGSPGVSLARTVIRVAKVVAIPTSTAILDCLSPGSPTLETLTERFRDLATANKMDVVCFHEQMKEPIRLLKKRIRVGGTIIVPEESACLFKDGARNYPLNTTHTSMNEFDNPRNGNFELVSEQVNEVARNASRVLKLRRPALFLVSHEPNPHFLGRKDIIDVIISRLQCEDNPQTRFGLWGLGGMGKTSIVTELAYMARETFAKTRTSMIFVRAGNWQLFSESFAEIAVAAGLPFEGTPGEDKLQRVSDWLKDPENGHWVLILDNADDPEIFGPKLNLLKYIPSCSHGSVIVTTRIRRVCLTVTSGCATDSIIHVDKLGIEDCRAFLERRLTPRQLGTFQSERDILIEALGNLPLTLEQAVGVMNNDEFTVRTFLELWRTSEEFRREVLGFGKSTDEQDVAQEKITATWVISFHQIKEKNPLAADILSFMSYLDRQNILTELFPSFGCTDVEFEKALGVLQSYSMISAMPNCRGYNMHALIQVAIRTWLICEKKEGMAITFVLKSLFAGFPTCTLSMKRSTYRKCRRLAPHLQSALRQAQNIYPFVKDEAEQPSIEAETGHSEKTENFSDYQMTKWYEFSLVLELSAFYDSQHEYEESGILRFLAWEESLKVFGNEYWLTIMLYYYLGISIRENGQLEDALNIHFDLKEYFYEDEKGYILNLCQMSKVYYMMERVGEADALVCEIFERSEKLLDSDDVDRLQAKRDWAVVKFRTGEDPAAGLIAITELMNSNVWGPSPDAPLYATLALDYARMGRAIGVPLEEEQELRYLVWQACDDAYGRDHPTTLEAKAAQIPLWEKEGLKRRAYEACVDVLERRRRVLGDDHPATQATRRYLSTLEVPEPDLRLEWMRNPPLDDLFGIKDFMKELKERKEMQKSAQMNQSRKRTRRFWRVRFR